MSNTNEGKAFEYACVLAFRDFLRNSAEVEIADSAPLRTAKCAYDSMSKDKQANLYSAALAGARVISRLEPRLQNQRGDAPLLLSLQTDLAGIGGDVRDLLCIRRQSAWEIGLSCKHNHHAVKHSRLSASIDFGEAWFGYGCDATYFNAVIPLFKKLREIREDARARGIKALWSDMPDKEALYYQPILEAFITELTRLASAHTNVPQRLVNYMVGEYDFYKVITDDSHRTTKIEAMNIAGTLNKPSGEIRSIVSIPRLKLPTCFYSVALRPGSSNTVIVACDNGWTLSMRIHNASKEVESSLKFDVQLESLPNSIYSQTEPW